MVFLDLGFNQLNESCLETPFLGLFKALQILSLAGNSHLMHTSCYTKIFECTQVQQLELMHKGQFESRSDVASLLMKENPSLLNHLLTESQESQESQPHHHGSQLPPDMIHSMFPFLVQEQTQQESEEDILGFFRRRARQSAF